MKFELPELGYAYNALEPYIDEETMKIHHTKHHQAYTDKLNAALEKHPEIVVQDAQELLKNLNGMPEDIRGVVRNNGGGYVNHNFFWQLLKKDVPFSGKIKTAIEKKFGSYEQFKDAFSAAAAGHFGSGWAWLCVTGYGDQGSAPKELIITTTPNQDSPLSQGLKPILGLDVWEHAYYLKYQNKRPSYIEAFFSVINWNKVNELYDEAME